MDSSCKKCSNILEGIFSYKKKKKKRGENFVVQDLLENIKSFFVSCLISIIVDVGFKVLVFEIVNGSSHLYFFLYVVCFPGVLSVWSLESMRSMRCKQEIRVKDEITND